MSVTEDINSSYMTTNQFFDPQLNSTKKSLKEMNSWEKSHATSLYLNNLQKYTNSTLPSNIAYFKGNLTYNKLSFGHSLLMRFISVISKEVKSGTYLDKKAVLD
jgi:menaquinone-dependent protoporphyrinogen IX oxidase